MQLAIKYHPKGERGATLLEVLISIVIISLGLLSVAALQSMSLKSNNGSYLRSQATILAVDLADRIRAAPDAAENGVYDNGSAGDRAVWDALVLNTLGAGSSGSVLRNNRQVTITVSWNDNRARIRDEGDNDDATLTQFIYRIEF